MSSLARLLLVDDDESNLITLSALLEDEHFTVVPARSLAEARLALAGPGAWAAVVLDHSLPDGEGTALVPDLAASRPATRVIVLTGAPERLGPVPGAHAVLAKGEPFEVLLGQLR